ncbi:alanyl-tRNA editing protein Aarsd1-B [Centruroides vittatus]|uniref:alanyl-tRNA editing protein Aarsd1-B n=1 Tax=Centruroides vittatus TaxID=120091 RepID=UPI00350F6F2D
MRIGYLNKFVKMVFACQRDSYLREYTSKVELCQPEELEIQKGKKKEKVKVYGVILDDTVLFPEGGGQPDDRGTINGFPVIRIIKRKSKAVHYVDKYFEPGDEVHLIVDWKRRFDHMQQHSGQHLITAVAENMYNFHTTSWNLGDELSYIELDTPTISNDKITELEEVLNEKIRENIPVYVNLFNRDAAELKEVRTRLELPDDENKLIRVVNIKGIDSNTCCGTHVSSLGHLQAIKLLYAEKGKKNKTNLYFVVGNRLLQYMSNCVHRERSMNNILKSPPEEHIHIADKLQKSLKFANKNLLNTTRDLAIAQAQLFKQLDPCPQFYSLHRKDAEAEFMSIFSGEVNDKNVLLFLTTGDIKGSGHMLITGPQEILEKYGPKICELLEGKGAGKNGRFQAKVNNLSKRPQAEELLKYAIECSNNHEK